MSGGYFDYKQYLLEQWKDELNELIETNGKEKTKEELKEIERIHGLEWLVKYPEDKFYHKYSDEVIEKMKELSELLRKTKVRIDAIDRFLSGDDGEDDVSKAFGNE